jgi:hypothetical protein
MKTTYPDKPIHNYNEWRAWLNSRGLTPEEKFEAEFQRIWMNYKSDIINARTKKL